MRRSLIVDITARLILPSALLFSVHLLLVGHDRPGGGFVGGLVAGAAIALLYVAGGVDEVRDMSPAPPWTVLGAGLAIAASTAVVPALLGQPVLDSWKLEADLPVLGHAKVGSALIFDVGVALVVVGLVLMIFEAFGDESRPGEEPTA